MGLKPTTINDDNVTREQWMLARAFIGVIEATNAPFCSTELQEQEEVNRDKTYIPNVARKIAEGASRMMIEDAIAVLEAALDQYEDVAINPLAVIGKS